MIFFLLYRIISVDLKWTLILSIFYFFLYMVPSVDLKWTLSDADAFQYIYIYIYIYILNVYMVISVYLKWMLINYYQRRLFRWRWCFSMFFFLNNFLHRIISVDPWVDANNLLSASTFTWTLMWFFRYHISSTLQPSSSL